MSKQKNNVLILTNEPSFFQTAIVAPDEDSYEVVIVSDMNQILQEISHHRFALVVFDITMLEIEPSFLQIFHQLRLNTPIVILSRNVRETSSSQKTEFMGIFSRWEYPKQSFKEFVESILQETNHSRERRPNYE